jgi:hypothetical protein
LRHLTGRDQGGTVVQGPQTPSGNGFQTLTQICPHGTHGLHQGVAVGGVVPVMVIGRFFAMHHSDHIEPFTATYRVMHHMQAWTHPDRDLVRAQMRRQISLRHHRSVGQVTGKSGWLISQQLLAHRTPHTIGPDQCADSFWLQAVGTDLQTFCGFTPPQHGLTQAQVGTQALRSGV